MEINIRLNKNLINSINQFLIKNNLVILLALLTILSILSFRFFSQNGLALAYNDARSHLDIARRVVEGLKPGLAQLGSVWLPLPHILTAITVWNDYMWHSGLAGAIISMFSFVGTGILIYKILEQLEVKLLGRFIGVFIFATNLNILYLQATAMTELLLIFTMTFGSYYILRWYKSDATLDLVMAGFWIMLSTLVRYDGWFLLAWATTLVAIKTFFIDGYKIRDLKQKIGETEGKILFFVSLAGFGIALWLLWNLLIFKDPFYFAFGPFSAKAQQDQLLDAGVLYTKNNLPLSFKFYFYALAYNSNTYILTLGILCALGFFLDKKISLKYKVAITTLISPFVFNILALYMGHSVLFIQGISGNTWFNVRYGVMLIPAISVFIGYAINKLKDIKWPVIGSILFVTFFAVASFDAVTIDDARVGSSQKNVSEVSGWLRDNAKDKDGFVLISAASHDAIIFSSGLPMSKFIHEGTGLYWKSATALPDKWARWIIMRTYDDNDQTYREIKNTEGFKMYNLVHSFPFADIYEIKPEYVGELETKPIYPNQR